MKKKFLQLFFLLLIIFSLQGCATLVLLGTGLSGVMTAQEVEEDYDGDLEYYIKDKANSTYDYIERKTSN